MHPDIHFIGHAQPLAMGNQMVTKGENIVPLQAQGWQHLTD
jgi:thiamine-monophosphate kinase